MAALAQLPMTPKAWRTAVGALPSLVELLPSAAIRLGSLAGARVAGAGENCELSAPQEW